MSVRLPAEDLTAAAFAPFGRVLEHTGRDDVTLVRFPGRPVSIEG